MKYSKSPLHISDTQMHSTHSFSLKVEHNGQCKHNFVHKKNAPGTFNPNLQRKKKYQTCYNSFLTGYGTVSIYILQLLILHRHKKKHCLIAAFKKETSYLKYAASVFHVLPKHLQKQGGGASFLHRGRQNHHKMKVTRCCFKWEGIDLKTTHTTFEVFEISSFSCFLKLCTARLTSKIIP